jgi:hypothetical protein
MRRNSLLSQQLPSLAAIALMAACGGGSGTTGTTTPPVEVPGDCEQGTSYDGTFAAIQEILFERHGCTQSVCHGSAASGGLDLSPDVAYANLVEVPSTAHRFARVTPGDNDRSFLWLKLAAATNPGSVEIAGSPMPSGGPPISADEIELLRLWIYAGAPETGAVAGTQELVSGCLPDVEPITIRPLPPPAPGEGVQLVMPPYLLPAASEHEGCFASWYDVSDQIPAELLTADGQRVRVSATEMRQDPQSHHLLVDWVDPAAADVHHPSFGTWTCKGGSRAGATCDPTDLAACSDGYCATEFKDGFACLGFGPPGTSIFQREGIGGAQAAQAHEVLPEGVYYELPVRGIIYWNSHAFNLTTQDHMMNARLNYMFADESHQTYPAQGIFDIGRIFDPSAAPFTEETLCKPVVLPQGARLYELGSHTHQRGKHFTIDMPDGTRVYESFVYNDPLIRRFDPPVAFDSPDPATRTLRFCSLYNNGLNPDGSPNVEKVTRYSRLPQSVFLPGVPGLCQPIACVNEGMVGRPCNGVDDDASCDSSPGAGDGWCDACAITGGESTENEMFLPLGSFYIER